MSNLLLLDTNALIALSAPGHPLFQWIEAALRVGGQAFTCSVAWHEYVRGPLEKRDQQRALRIIKQRIEPLGREAAEIAAVLFNATGRCRGSTADCLIAAVTLCKNAQLVTWNTDDFRVFVPHGLKLAEMDKF